MVGHVSARGLVRTCARNGQHERDDDARLRGGAGGDAALSTDLAGRLGAPAELLTRTPSLRQSCDALVLLDGARRIWLELTRARFPRLIGDRAMLDDDAGAIQYSAAAVVGSSAVAVVGTAIEAIDNPGGGHLRAAGAVIALRGLVSLHLHSWVNHTRNQELTSQEVSGRL